MLSNIILLFIVLLLLMIVLQYSKNKKEEFFDFPGQQHNKFVETSTRKLNSLTNMINIPDPVIPFTANARSEMQSAVGNLTQSKNSVKPIIQYDIPDNLPNSLLQALECQKSGPTCNAFDDPTFSANCGMSFDVNGIGSDGKPHIGGLFLSNQDRGKQAIDAQHVIDNGSPPYDPYKVYQPTIGTSKPGTFGITKDSCIVVKEKVDCNAKKTFGSPNCTQCYTSLDFARVGPDTPRIGSMLVLIGNGSFAINSGTANTGVIQFKETELSADPIQVEIPPNTEGVDFFIHIRYKPIITQYGDPKPKYAPLYISGYIQGETPKGSFKLDIKNLIRTDNVTHGKPRINGTKRVNGFRCVSIVPGAKQTWMSLYCLMPFSFLSMYDGDALTCDNGPIITKAASAVFLESDPCYSKDNKPGNYKLECLQDRWMQLGGTAEGTGYPTSREKADAIQKDANGAPLDIDTIIDTLSEIMIKALTGKDRNGTILSIPDWNTASMFATGVPINAPCDGPGGAEPISQQCLAYLYANKGSTSRVGSTYSLPATQYGHSKGEGFTSHEKKKVQVDSNAALVAAQFAAQFAEQFTDSATYNYPGTVLDPNTQAGLDFAQTLGGINTVKQTYDHINRLANDNTKTNEFRADAVRKAYGVNLGSADSKKNDFDIRIPAGQPAKTYDDLKQYCKSKGKRICESTEICDMRTRTVNNLDLTSEFPGDNWIAVGDKENEWLTLNRGDNRYCKTHTEVANYLPGWGLQRVPGGWERLVKCCSEGLFVKGRYIKLQYTRQDYLNLAQIAVYSTKDGPNVITPSTTVHKSSNVSGWGGSDWFPSRNFVDGIGLGFVHTSGNEIPWIQIDLGSEMPIYKIVIMNRGDCCKERILGSILSISNEKEVVYTSNPISSTNTIYSWYPTKPDVFVDIAEDAFKRPQQWAYGDNGTVSCNRYCGGIGGGPWNNELPRDWNGARCVGHVPVIGSCDSLFTNHSGAGCLCEKTGQGWK